VRRSLLLVVALATATTGHVEAQGPSDVPRLASTTHAPLPALPSQYWLVPDEAARTAAQRDNTPTARFARGAKLIAEGQHAAGLPLVRGADLQSTPLAAYAQYYTGLALAGLNRFDEAESILSALDVRDPAGYLEEAVPMQLAEVAIATRDTKSAVDHLEDLSDEKLSAPEEVFLRLGRAAEAAGDWAKALTAYRRVYYDFPLSAQASDAQSGIERLESPSLALPTRYKHELARAQRLFDARRWAQARAGFAALTRAASGDDRRLIALRLAECDYYLDRHRASRDALRPFLDGGSREAEARFFHLTATRALGDHTTYTALARGLVNDHPATEWAEETLNNLASHYLIVDNDAEADRVFRELYRRYPKSRHADRAAWKAGWWSYRSGDFAETVNLFESAAANFPRADYRPAWLYWAARAREQMGEQTIAAARYRLVVGDYQNSYYGREAMKRLEARREPAVQRAVATERPVTSVTSDTPGVPTDALIRALGAAGLYDDALREVQYAQRVWGDGPVLQATSAWLRHQQGLGLKATERFTALRGAINTMRRAYPQFMAAGGETLPPDVLRIIFPLDYWPLIKKYSDLHKLDPYLIAALMAQESTFTAEIRSHANAYGLMQIIPGTGRRYARKLGIRFTTASLTNAETNVRLGTLYFKELIDRFGGAHFALASYNAGEHRVARWLQESPGLAQDEFIDSIPFPETQTYVKRILWTAEDYRRLYGGGILTPANIRPATPRRTE
jgi:soluble lytic murein transglycosylase